MTSYSLMSKKEGTIEFWTDDDELRDRVMANLRDIVDAVSFRRSIQRINKLCQEEQE